MPVRQARYVTKAASRAAHVLLRAIERTSGGSEESPGCAQCSPAWVGCHLNRKMLNLLILVIILPTIHTGIS